MAPRVPMKYREVVYTLSPFQQSVLNGLWYVDGTIFDKARRARIGGRFVGE